MLNAPKNGGVILAIFLLLLLCVFPVFAYDIECSDVTTTAKNFNHPARTGAGDVGTITAIKFYDIGSRQGFKGVVWRGPSGGIVIDGGAPASAWTTLTFQSNDGLTDYGTGIIGYNYLLDVGHYQIFVEADNCNMFAGLDGLTIIKLNYNTSKIYNIHPHDAAALSGSTVEGSYIAAMMNWTYGGSAGQQWVTGMVTPSASYDCYDIDVGIDVTYDTPTDDFNQFNITRNGWDATISLDDDWDELSPFYNARNMLDESSLGDAPESDIVYWYIQLHGTSKICNGTYPFGAVVNMELNAQCINANTNSLINGANFTFKDVQTSEETYYLNTDGFAPTSGNTYGGDMGDWYNFSCNKSGFIEYDKSSLLFQVPADEGAYWATLYLIQNQTPPSGYWYKYFVVTSQEGTPVNGATVEITNESSGAKSSITTNAAGYGRYQAVEGITYSFVVSKSGFPSSSGEFTLTANEVNRIKFSSSIPTTATTIPTPTTTTPPLTISPDGGAAGGIVDIWAHYLGVEGWLILAIIALLASVAVGSGAGYVVGLNGGTGGGYAFVMGFLGTFVTCSIMWRELLIFDIVMIIAGIAIIVFMGRGSGGG